MRCLRKSATKMLLAVSLCYSVFGCAVAEGILDTTFNGQGYAVYGDTSSGYLGREEAHAIAIDSSGRIVVVGTARSSFYRNMAIWRYLPDGTLDASFGETGYVTHADAAGVRGDSEGLGVALQADGKIVVTGYCTNGTYGKEMIVWRYNPDGTLDTTFGFPYFRGFYLYRNYATVPSGYAGSADDAGSAVIIESSGRILVAGSAYFLQWENGYLYMTIDMCLWALTPQGLLDDDFGPTRSGWVSHANAGAAEIDFTGSGHALAVDAAIGRILITGNSGEGDMMIWAFTLQGWPDFRFGPNGQGFAVHRGDPSFWTVDVGYSIVCTDTGDLLVAGRSSKRVGTNGMAVWRYLSDGTIDTSFGAGDGYVVYDAAWGSVGRSVAVDAGGRIIVAGEMPVYAQGRDLAIWALNADGSLNSSFGGQGFVTHHNAGGANGDDWGNAMAFDSDGRILVAGATWSNTNVDPRFPSYDMAIWRYR